ncbi:hypothetical protein ABZ923_32210 [Streptomyces sp. NPDC046881]|uniref:hypothetical protein n=1 Tax=Streptomyces sp. NPDC046881 TaxID=3155374 RepID=UPI0033E78511
MQNRIIPAAKLRADPNGLIVFGEENQGGFVWSLPRTPDDPEADLTVCPWYLTQFHVAPGLVLHVSGSVDDNSFSVWAGATHRSALAPLADAAVEWNQFDV